MLAVGVMSGTSLDGVDAVLARIRPRAGSYAVDLLNFLTVPFEEQMLARLRSVLAPNTGSVQELAQLHRELGRVFAQAAETAAGDTPVDYVACHGQTVWHDGAQAITLQIGDAFVIREQLQTTVCYDFRSADCAAGGHGAPLVPYADALLLGNDEEDRVAVNIGGIANLTVIARGAAPQDVIAFDSGPGNMLIDACVQTHTRSLAAYDKNGELALAGRADQTILQTLLAHPYFSHVPPKSAGRELFGEQFLRGVPALQALSLEDRCATLTALTAQTLADAIAAYAPPGARVLASGGGAHNRALLEALQERLPRSRVERSDAMGIHVDAKEALAFALLGYETLRERAAGLPNVTGAQRAVCLGAIAPKNLLALLSKVAGECRA